MTTIKYICIYLCNTSEKVIIVFYVRCYISQYPISFHGCVNHPDVTSSNNSHWYLTVFICQGPRGRRSIYFRNCLEFAVYCWLLCVNPSWWPPKWLVPLIINRWLRSLPKNHADAAWVSSHVDAVLGKWLTRVERESVVCRD